MMKGNEDALLRGRVIVAAERALADHSYVSVIDVLTGMGLLAPSNVERWRKGQVDFLDDVIQGKPGKIAASIEVFHRWAQLNELKPHETRYVRNTPAGTVDLRFSKRGDPGIEQTYRTHFISPGLPQQKQQRLQEKLDQAPKTVVFQVLRDSRCSECGAEIDEGDLLLMEAKQPLCMACARLDGLEFLPSGNTALTRRAGKYSSQSVVVVRFSRSRGRYERQGILVEPVALEKAEKECTLDADQRAAERAKAAKRRAAEDDELALRMEDRIRVLFPGCPPGEAAAIARHTSQRGSGRVGRTAAGQKLDDAALMMAVHAAVRHRHTNYDDLLGQGLDREMARALVAEKIEDVLGRWRK